LPKNIKVLVLEECPKPNHTGRVIWGYTLMIAGFYAQLLNNDVKIYFMNPINWQRLIFNQYDKEFFNTTDSKLKSIKCAIDKYPILEEWFEQFNKQDDIADAVNMALAADIAHGVFNE